MNMSAARTSNQCFMEVLKTALIVSVPVFLLTVILYGNPWVNRLYQKSMKIGTIKTWKSQGKFLVMNYFFILIETLLFAWVFSIITIHPATDWIAGGVYFGVFLCLIRIIPRSLDTFAMVHYPLRLLIAELINGCIISFLMGIGISYFIF